MENYVKECLPRIAPPMLKAAYRLRHPITVVILRGTRGRFHRLNSRSILIPTSEPDAAGLIEAKYEDGLVQVFERDLDEASEQIEIDASPEVRSIVTGSCCAAARPGV
jgi:hypothetical protein